MGDLGHRPKYIAATATNRGGGVMQCSVWKRNEHLPSSRSTRIISSLNSVEMTMLAENTSNFRPRKNRTTLLNPQLRCCNAPTIERQILRSHISLILTSRCWYFNSLRELGAAQTVLPIEWYGNLCLNMLIWLENPRQFTPSRN